MARGRPRKSVEAQEPETPAVRPLRVYKSPMDIVGLMQRYQVASNGKVRGLFEDCKADIYKLWLLDYNDWRLQEVRATGTSDRVYGEWARKFARAFGDLGTEVAA